MIRDHGLVEYRSTISMLIDRLESPHFEVAVFGRVSSGKSSLLNYFLKRELLPIGVTPITAIPIRILYGEAPSAIIHFSEGHKEQVDLLRLPEFASEQQNPGNARHVTQIRVEIPEQYLKQGVIFVDTPGMGSLAASGAAETLAYLPRCDLGVVLIDAASTLNQEDLAILRMLYESGAQVMVLLSKSDLLTPEERRKAADYIRQNITAQTGGTFPVLPVSVMGFSRQLADQWFEGGLIPLLEKQQEAASASLRRKVGALRDAIMATLQNLLDSQHPSFMPDRSEGKRTLRKVQKLGQDQRQSALILCEEMARELESASDLIFQETAGVLAENWRKKRLKEIDVSEPLAETCLRQVSSVGNKVAACLNQMKEQLAGILSETSSISSQSVQQMEDWPGISGLPMFDPAPIRRSFRVRRPLAYFFGQQALQSWLQEKMQKEYGVQLYEMMHQYRKRLESWSRESLSEISRYFETKMEFCKAGLNASNRGASTQVGETNLAIETDLKVLSVWPVKSAASSKPFY
jgi:GTP-binding protein EngB required for normal cell division